MSNMMKYFNNVVATLDKIGDKKVTKPIVEMLADEDADVRSEAVGAISKLEDPRVVDILIEILEDSDASVRKMAINYLSAKKDPKVADALIRMFDDEDFDVREFAAEMLCKIGNSGAIDPIIKILKAHDTDTVSDLKKSLHELGYTNEPDLYKALWKRIWPRIDLRAASAFLPEIIFEDLAQAFWGTSESLQGHLKSIVSNRVWERLLKILNILEPDEQKKIAARNRILDKFLKMISEFTFSILYLPLQQDGHSISPKNYDLDPWRCTAEQIVGIMIELSKMARREGIFILESVVFSHAPFFTLAKDMTVDWENPDRMESVLREHKEQYLNDASIRLNIIKKGLVLLTMGEDTCVLHEKLYEIIGQDNVQEFDEQCSISEIRNKINDLAQKIDQWNSPLPDIVDVLANLSMIARDEGILSLEFIQFSNAPYLKKGLEFSVDGFEPSTIDQILSVLLKTITGDISRHLELGIQGFMRIAREDNPRELEQRLFAYIPEQTSEMKSFFEEFNSRSDPEESGGIDDIEIDELLDSLDEDSSV